MAEGLRLRQPGHRICALSSLTHKRSLTPILQDKSLPFPSLPQESIETMRIRLERSIQVLTLLRAFEARDRNLQEGNLERVNFWSAVNVAVLLLVAVLQVCTLKRFFQDKRPVPM